MRLFVADVAVCGEPFCSPNSGLETLIIFLARPSVLQTLDFISH